MMLWNPKPITLCYNQLVDLRKVAKIKKPAAYSQFLNINHPIGSRTLYL